MKPKRIVAYAYQGNGRWWPLPIQIDERKLVDFGRTPTSNATPGQTGTVYGTEPNGVEALQYADPHTFVGADDDPALDSDDEVVLGYNNHNYGPNRPGLASAPSGTRASSATRVRIKDPLDAGGGIFTIFVFEGGKKASRPGADYVDYDFALDSGSYKASYQRADGPNPEHSVVETKWYTAGFSDRWFFDRLESGVAPDPTDMLDGFKFQFGPSTCGRSEATFNDAEGAFVANIDGPIRAIRSYVGANSGPLTERTHYFYGRRHVIVTDLRVHAVPGPLIYHDLSAEAVGMRYLDSVNRTPVPVDGEPDQVSSVLPQWRGWIPPSDSGQLGSIWSADRVEGSFTDGLLAQATGWYLDDATPEPNQQCWGDGAAYAQAGFRSTYSMPNTDPSIGGTDSLRSTTTDIMSPPVPPGFDVLLTADHWADQLDAPLEARTYPERVSSG